MSTGTQVYVTRVRHKLIYYTFLWEETESCNMVYNISRDISKILFSHFLPLQNKALFQFCSTNSKQRFNSLADSQKLIIAALVRPAI